MKLKEIFRSDRSYSVCGCDRVAGPVIDVVCGGAAMYSHIVELTGEETAEFREKGHLDDLAYRIAKGDEEILRRELSPEGGEKLEKT